MPSNTGAWLESAKANPMVVRESPYTSPGPGEITVKNSAIAINPVDWKIQDSGAFIQQYPVILGSCIAGTVVEVGPDVTQFKVGDRVFGHGQSLRTSNAAHGAFQHYTVLHTGLAGQLPSNISWTEGCVLPMGINTAASGLFQKDFLALDPPKVGTQPNGRTVFIHGASSSVGACAVQLAKAAGYEVFTTASSRNHAMCRDLGADKVFDYNDANFIDEIVAALKGKDVVGAFDAIASETTVKACAEILKKAGSGQIVATVLPGSEEYAPEADVRPVFCLTIQWNEVGPMLWVDYMPKALEAATFKPKPDAMVVGQGLEYIQKAIDTNKKGVSGSKVVVTL